MGFASVFSNKLKNCTQFQSTSLPTMLKLINDVADPPKFSHHLPTIWDCHKPVLFKDLEESIVINRIKLHSAIFWSYQNTN